MKFECRDKKMSRIRQIYMTKVSILSVKQIEMVYIMQVRAEICRIKMEKTRNLSNGDDFARDLYVI